MTAYIHPTALVNPGFCPAPFTIIDEGAAIFADVSIGSFVMYSRGRTGARGLRDRRPRDGRRGGGASRWGDRLGLYVRRQGTHAAHRRCRATLGRLGRRRNRDGSPVVVESGAVVGARCVVGDGSIIATGCALGDDVTLGAACCSSPERGRAGRVGRHGLGPVPGLAREGEIVAPNTVSGGVTRLDW